LSGMGSLLEAEILTKTHRIGDLGFGIWEKEQPPPRVVLAQELVFVSHIRTPNSHIPFSAILTSAR